MTCGIRKSAVDGLKIILAGVAIIGVTSISAAAQETSAAGPERIIITPPQYLMKQAPVPDAAKYGFAVAQSTSLSQPMSYSDLDLSSPDGVKELEKRVTRTATDVCRELKRRFPDDLYHSVTQFEPSRRQDCVQDAVKNTMAQIMTNRRAG